MKTKKIIKALKIIMDECGKYDDSCKECIFSNEEYGYECPFDEMPDEWNTKYIKKKIEEL